MVLEYLEPVVRACRECGFEAVRLLQEMQTMPPLDGFTAERVFGDAFIQSVKLCPTPHDAYHKFCDQLALMRNNTALIWMVLAARGIGNDQLANLILAEIDMVRLDANLSYKHRAEIDELLAEIYTTTNNPRNLRNTLPVLLKRIGKISRLDDYFDRHEDEQRLRSAIGEMLGKKQGSILVTGEGGIGKTMLVSQSIYFDDNYLRSLSISTVLWLNVYQFSQLDSDNGPMALFDELAALLNVPVDRNSKQHRLAEYLRQISRDVGKTLLVLDDVFSEAIFSAGRELLRDNVYLLAISRHCTVIGIHTSTVDVEIKRLSDDVIRKMFANLTTKLNFSSGRVAKLIHLCSGLPLLARVIMAKFRNCRNSKQADVVLKKLLEQFPQSFINFEWSDEKKQATISRLLLVGFDEESETFRERYFAFLFFPEGSTIDLADLAILWQCSESDATEQAMEFENRSLVRPSWSENGEEERLNIHAYLYAAALQFSAKHQAGKQKKSHLKLREGILRQTTIRSFRGENAFHASIRRKRWLLLEAIQQILLLGNGSLLFDICSQRANDGRTPLDDLMFALDNWADCQEWQVNTRAPLPIFCSFVDRMLAVNSKRALDILKASQQSLLTSLLKTVRDGVKWYKNALLIAAANEHLELAQVLLDEGANINTVDDLGCNIMIKAADTDCDRSVIVEKFLEHGSSLIIDVANKHGRTALMVACELGFVDTVRVLLESTDPICNPSTRDTNGETALHYAARNGYVEIVELLLEKVATESINWTNNNGESALWHAKLQDNQRVSERLERAGAELTQEELEFFEIVRRVAHRENHAKTQTINKALFRFLIGRSSAINPDADSFLTSVYNSADNIAEVAMDGYTLGKDDIDSGFLIAAFLGYAKVAELFLKDKMANIETRGRYYDMSALMIASKRGHLQVVAMLIKKKADVNARNKDGWSPLMFASKYGHREIAALLIENQADVNGRDKDGWSPLTFASESGHRDIAALLVENKGDVDARDSVGRSALMIASQNGGCEVVALLIESKADVNARDKGGWSPLTFASENGHREVAALLIESQADVDARDNDGCSPLMVASQNGCCEVAALLIEKKADVDSRDSEGMSALMVASKNGHREVATLLFESEADVNARDKDGWSPLTFASECGHWDIAAFLIEKKVDVDARDISEGKSALMIASNNGHREVTKLLIENEADVNARDNDGWSPLMYASEDGHHEVAALLIESKADVDARDNDGTSPLMIASFNGHCELVDLLLRSGSCEIDARDDSGTSLIFASENGHSEVVQLLLQHGANVNLKSSDSGECAIDIARRLKHAKIVQILEQHSLTVHN